mmetsp:Transcript_123163/g.394458  ORF Transcript_123163/g.394458 Transcript_123163/m.394458 type:complete len:129 (+) Transcript_123163:3-389(+)
MILASVSVNLLLWALVAWAMQQYLEQHYNELTRPLPQHVDLEWLDYRSAELKKEVQVSWHSVPRIVRTLYILGAGIHIASGHALWHRKLPRRHLVGHVFGCLVAVRPVLGVEKSDDPSATPQETKGAG